VFGWSAVITITTAIVAARRGPWVRTCLVACVLAVICFFPTYLAARWAFDAALFGRSEYSRQADLTDGRIARWIPPSATELAVDESAGGFIARFTVEPTEFAAFIETLWESKRRADASQRQPAEAVGADRLGPDFAFRWPAWLAAEWADVADAEFQQGPIAANGGGCRFFYSSARRQGVVEVWWW
jgi:hypothetical protein